MNPLQIDPALTFIGIVIFLLLNMGVWVFAWGKIRGKTATRLNNVETNLKNPAILPECIEIFGEIREKLVEVSTNVDNIDRKVETNIEVRDKVMELSGKVEATFLFIKESQKNDEKRRS